MHYFALLLGPEPTEQPDAATEAQIMHAYAEFHAAASPALLAGAALHPPSTATTVRVRDGQAAFTDGPYAEGAEVANGFYVLRAADRDEAVKLASMIPATTVELRRLADVGGL